MNISVNKLRLIIIWKGKEKNHNVLTVHLLWKTQATTVKRSPIHENRTIFAIRHTAYLTLPSKTRWSTDNSPFCKAWRYLAKHGTSLTMTMVRDRPTNERSAWNRKCSGSKGRRLRHWTMTTWIFSVRGPFDFFLSCRKYWIQLLHDFFFFFNSGWWMQEESGCCVLLQKIGCYFFPLLLFNKRMTCFY